MTTFSMTDDEAIRRKRKRGGALLIILVAVNFLIACAILAWRL